MAIPSFQAKIFDGPSQLVAFVQTNVTTVYEIIYDQNGKYVLFYA